MELFKKLLSWKFIKGGHGYGFEIIQTSKEGGKRVAILDCQDSVQEEYDTGFSIVPKTHCRLGANRVLNPINENRFSDEELQLNGRLIANAPEMLNLLMEIYFSSILFSTDAEESEEMNYKIYKLIYDKIGIKPRDMINDEYKKESVQQE